MIFQLLAENQLESSQGQRSHTKLVKFIAKKTKQNKNLFLKPNFNFPNKSMVLKVSNVIHVYSFLIHSELGGWWL